MFSDAVLLHSKSAGDALYLFELSSEHSDIKTGIAVNCDVEQLPVSESLGFPDGFKVKVVADFTAAVDSNNFASHGIFQAQQRNSTQRAVVRLPFSCSVFVQKLGVGSAYMTVVFRS